MNSVLSTANAHIDDSTRHERGRRRADGDQRRRHHRHRRLARGGDRGRAARAGIGVAIGVSVARNLIGSTPDGGGTPAETQAYVLRSSIDAPGAT